jgi:hypothetical protein
LDGWSIFVYLGGSDCSYKEASAWTEGTGSPYTNIHSEPTLLHKLQAVKKEVVRSPAKNRQVLGEDCKEIAEEDSLDDGFERQEEDTENLAPASEPVEPLAGTTMSG